MEAVLENNGITFRDNEARHAIVTAFTITFICGWILLLGLLLLNRLPMPLKWLCSLAICGLSAWGMAKFHWPVPAKRTYLRMQDNSILVFDAYFKNSGEATRTIEEVTEIVVVHANDGETESVLYLVDSQDEKLLVYRDYGNRPAVERFAECLMFLLDKPGTWAHKNTGKIAALSVEDIVASPHRG